MKNQSPSTSHRCTPHPVKASAPLTITLDAKASHLVRWYAREFNLDPHDVANGILLDSMPQAHKEWSDDQRAIARGDDPAGGIYNGYARAIAAAARRRRALTTAAK